MKYVGRDETDRPIYDAVYVDILTAIFSLYHLFLSYIYMYIYAHIHL